MIRSMTGFASATGSLPPYGWSWELRSVNAKGQDLRLRVPDWIEGLESGLRRKLGQATARGAVTLSLRVTREEAAGQLQLNSRQLDATLRAIATIEARAGAAGLALAPSRAVDILALRGMTDAESGTGDTAGLASALLVQADALIMAFNRMRTEEGAALAKILSQQLDQIESGVQEAVVLAQGRRAVQSDQLRQNLARVLDNSDGADPDRVAQELALIAVKSDVTEEIDRLGTHVVAARALIGEGGMVGRKLDFLTQELNREVNTLCSKAQNSDLSRCGLELKAVIDRMREQVQNVE